jgi:hypothetical protein
LHFTLEHNNTPRLFQCDKQITLSASKILFILYKLLHFYELGNFAAPTVGSVKWPTTRMVDHSRCCVMCRYASCCTILKNLPQLTFCRIVKYSKASFEGS